MPDRSDFELGDEPVEVQRRRRPGVVLSVRLSPEEVEQVQRLAEANRMTLSQVVRDALTAYLRGGPGRTVAGAPGTATITGFSNLELVWNGQGPTNLTRGSVQAATPTTAPTA